MSSAAFDYNDMPVRWQQHNPDAPDDAEYKTAESQQWIDDWINGELADVGTTYSGPYQRLIDNEPELIADLMRDWRRGDAAEIERSTGRLMRAMERYVRGEMQ